MNIRPKVLLIYPGNRSRGFAYTLGLLFIAKSLIEMEIDVTIFHMGIDNINKLKNEKYLFVGITMLTGNMIRNGLRAAKFIKQKNYQLPIVLGGVHPSMLPEESLQNELVDIVVIGEGEKTVQELALCLQKNGDLSKVKGIAYKDKQKNIFVNAPREYLDINTLNMDLPYHLLGKSFSTATVMPVHTSRGCPYRCSFCYSINFNKRRYRAKTAERVVNDIEFLHKTYGISNFNFDYEDEFFIDPVRVYNIFDSIIKKGLKIQWTSFCRFNSFISAYEKYGEAFIDLLKKSGCYYMSFGAESASQRLLDEVIKKDITVDQIIKTIELIKKYKISHRVTFINGFPTETREDLDAIFRLIEKLSFDNPYIMTALINLMPFPGTPIYGLLQKEYGYKVRTSLIEWEDYETPIKLKDMTWLDKNYANLCYNIILMGFTPFYKDFKNYRNFKEYVYNSSYAYHSGYLFYLLTKIERWRYINRFFDYNFEVVLAKNIIWLYFSLKNYLVNSIIKKYMPNSVIFKLKKWFGVNDWEYKKKNAAK